MITASHRQLQITVVIDDVQVTTIIERITADARHAIRNLNARQTATISERIRADARHACRNLNAR